MAYGMGSFARILIHSVPASQINRVRYDAVYTV